MCEDKTGNIKRENIIPFALSQGGDYSRHNLFSEVNDTIIKNGYLHEGMKKLLDFLRDYIKKDKGELKRVNETINWFWQCFPMRPTHCGCSWEQRRKLCELFVPYHHAMKSFYSLIGSLFVTPMPPQSSFGDDGAFAAQAFGKAAPLGKNNIQQMMQMKPKAAKATCRRFQMAVFETRGKKATLLSWLQPFRFR